MRVTKAIREYVEEEIRRKYDAKKLEVGKEYRQEQETVKGKLQEFLDEANEKAEEYLKSVRFEAFSYRYPATTFNWNGTPRRQEIEDIINEERRLLDAKCNAKIKQVLFDLEMGDTAKAELKEILDNIVVD